MHCCSHTQPVAFLTIPPSQRLCQHESHLTQPPNRPRNDPLPSAGPNLTCLMLCAVSLAGAPLEGADADAGRRRRAVRARSWRRRSLRRSWRHSRCARPVQNRRCAPPRHPYYGPHRVVEPSTIALTCSGALDRRTRPRRARGGGIHGSGAGESSGEQQSVANRCEAHSESIADTRSIWTASWHSLQVCAAGRHSRPSPSLATIPGVLDMPESQSTRSYYQKKTFNIEFS